MPPIGFEDTYIKWNANLELEYKIFIINIFM